MPSVTLAGPNWAEVLSAVMAPLAILATLLVGYWAWRAAVPHRKMAYSIEFTPLLSSSHSGLTVSLSSERIAQPQTATLKLTNLGNREIEAANFNGESIEFRMNARVVSVLTSASTDSRRVPPATIHGNALQIDPYVIHKGQEITYKLLLDGGDPRLSLRHSVSARFKEDVRAKRAGYIGLGAAIATLVVSVVTLIPAIQAFTVSEETSKEDLRQTIQEDRQKWYEKGKRDAERESAGQAGPSPSSSKSPEPR
ncbi:hypothetical protein [Streptomyces sp. NPDC046631]|uniref:hypothetical protein n=1 Tax=unclassified Streptomyces TaxID=2593676 RepID=UPI0033C40F73